MATKTKDSNLSLEERLEQALIPNWDEPYKLPPNWCWVKLSSISAFERGITFPASAKESSSSATNIPCLRTANVQETLELSDLLYVDKSYMKDNSNKLIRENDIIMSTANSRELVGKTSFVHSLTEEMTFGGFIMAIRSKINPKYLFYFLRLQFLNGKFMGNSTQTTNIANINSTSLGETEIPIPPLEEQKCIVSRIESIFTKLDEAKEKAQEVVDGFESRKAAILHKAFSGELTAKWREEHINIVEESSERLLGDIIFESRLGLVRSKIEQDNTKKYLYLKMNNITNDGELDLSEFVRVDATEQEVCDFKLEYGDFLFNTRNSYELVGKNTVWNKKESIPILFNNNIMRIRFKNDINPFYISFYLNSPKGREELNKCKKNTTNIAAIYAKNLFAIKIPLIDYEEQNQLVFIVKQLMHNEFQAKEKAESILEQIDTMKKAILARAFRGELGTNDPSEESAVELLKNVLLGNTNQQEPTKSNKKSTSIPKHIEVALLTKLEKKIVSLFYATESKVVSVGEIMSVSSKKIDIIDTLTKLEQRGIVIRLDNSYYRIKE